MESIKVAVVGDGNPGVQSKESYRELAEMYVRTLNRRTTRPRAGGDETLRTFDAVVVDSVVEALEGHLSGLRSSYRPRHALIFISNRFLAQARLLADNHQKYFRVVVITGSFPVGEPLVLPKGDVDSEMLCNILE